MSVVGNTNIESSTGQLSGNILGLVATPDVTGNIASISAYLTPTGTRNVTYAIYRASDDSLVAQTEQISVSGSAGWFTANFVTPPLLTASETYYILAWADGSFQCTIARVSSSGAGRFSSTAYTGTYPDPLTTSTNNFRYSIYATYITPENTIEKQIVLGTDDAHQASDGTMDLANTALALSSSITWLGLRFQDIDIPQGAVIESALLEIYIPASAPFDFDDIDVNVYAEDSDNSSTFTSSSGNISSRTLTTEFVNWIAANAGVNDTQVSSDISDVIQEVIDRVGWTSGNSLSLILNRVGNSFFMRSFEGNSSQSARLTVEYSVPSGESHEANAVFFSNNF